MATIIIYLNDVDEVVVYNYIKRVIQAGLSHRSWAKKLTYHESRIFKFYFSLPNHEDEKVIRRAWKSTCSLILSFTPKSLEKCQKSKITQKKR